MSEQPRWSQRLHQDIRDTLAIDPQAYSLKISQSRAASFRYAVAGWLHMLRYQKNIRIQVVASGLVFGGALWLRLAARDLAVIVLVVGLVWMAEFVNAAVEAAINLASPDFHPMAKVGKDVAAATVLLAVVTSVVVGLLILGPPFWERLSL